jgi:hypothetical protein
MRLFRRIAVHLIGALSMVLVLTGVSPGPQPVAPDEIPMLGFHIAGSDAAHLAAARGAGGTYAADIEPEPN